MIDGSSSGIVSVGRGEIGGRAFPRVRSANRSAVGSRPGAGLGSVRSVNLDHPALLSPMPLCFSITRGSAHAVAAAHRAARASSGDAARPASGGTRALPLAERAPGRIAGCDGYGCRQPRRERMRVPATPATPASAASDAATASRPSGSPAEARGLRPLPASSSEAVPESSPSSGAT